VLYDIPIFRLRDPKLRVTKICGINPAKTGRMLGMLGAPPQGGPAAREFGRLPLKHSDLSSGTNDRRRTALMAGRMKPSTPKLIEFAWRMFRRVATVRLRHRPDVNRMDSPRTAVLFLKHRSHHGIGTGCSRHSGSPFLGPPGCSGALVGHCAEHRGSGGGSGITNGGGHCFRPARSRPGWRTRAKGARWPATRRYNPADPAGRARRHPYPAGDELCHGSAVDMPSAVERAGERRRA
jgi:hypothetical protein